MTWLMSLARRMPVTVPRSTALCRTLVCPAVSPSALLNVITISRPRCDSVVKAR